MKRILAVLLVLCPMAWAELDTSGLSPEQLSRLKIQAEQMRANQEVDNTKKYIEMGQMIGQALSSSAKEMGVAVNEFAQTPVGKMVAALVIWRFFGRDAMHFLFGGLFLLVFVPLWIYLYRRMCLIKSAKYGAGFWIFRAKEYIYYDNADVGDARVGMIALLLILIAASQGIMWSGS